MLTTNLLQSLWQIYSCCALFYESACKHRCKITYLPSTVKVNTTVASGGVVVSVGVIRWKWVVLILRKGKWDDNAPSVAETLIMLHLGHLENGNWVKRFPLAWWASLMQSRCPAASVSVKTRITAAKLMRRASLSETMLRPWSSRSLILFIYLFIHFDPLWWNNASAGWADARC